MKNRTATTYIHQLEKKTFYRVCNYRSDMYLLCTKRIISQGLTINIAQKKNQRYFLAFVSNINKTCILYLIGFLKSQVD